MAMDRINEMVLERLGKTARENEPLFCAAVTGLCANPEAAAQGAEAIVRMARGIVRAAYDNDPDRMFPDYVGTPEVPSPPQQEGE